MKILGIDYGTKRIGLAMSDDDCKFGLPLEVVENNDEFVEKIRSLAHEREFTEVVIGESRDYKG
jgi:putative Holliday junction resolvase